MTRTIAAILACSVISHAQLSPKTVTGTYRFTTPQTAQGLQEAATIVRTVAAAPETSIDASSAALIFNGPAEAVDFAEWALPVIDRATGDDAIHEHVLPSGDIGRVLFVPGLPTPQASQELLTILRVVADIQKIFPYTPNRAFVLRGPDWQVAFAAWIAGQLNQSKAQKSDSAPREFTVGGPDYRGLGHGARINFLTGITLPLPTQELLTVLRTVGDVQKVFTYNTSHALIFRAGDSDLQRAEWIIQGLDLPAEQVLATTTFTAPAGDDVTRIFRLRNAAPQWIQMAVAGLRSDLAIKKIFPTTATPAPTIVVRGTTDQIAAATKWMVSHNALFE